MFRDVDGLASMKPQKLQITTPNPEVCKILNCSQLFEQQTGTEEGRAMICRHRKTQRKLTWNVKCCGAAVICKVACVVVLVPCADTYPTGDFKQLVCCWHSGGVGFESLQASVLPQDRRLGVSLWLTGQQHVMPLCRLLYAFTHWFIRCWRRSAE